MDDVLVWTCEAHGYTQERAIREFARNFWGKPRKPRIGKGNRFTIEGGVATYRIDLECDTHWWIWREADPSDQDPHPLD